MLERNRATNFKSDGIVLPEQSSVDDWDALTHGLFDPGRLIAGSWTNTVQFVLDVGHWQVNPGIIKNTGTLQTLGNFVDTWSRHYDTSNGR